MTVQLLQGILLPFLGTVLGAACVFFMKEKMSELVQRMLMGFAAGVMVAASIWSLLIPAMDLSAEEMGNLAFMPAAVGFWIGTLFLLLLDHIIPHLHGTGESEGPKTSLKKTTKLVLAVGLHNIPEGMAVGVVLAGWLAGDREITFAAALILAVGIAIQNFPEGAIISMPLRSEGMSKPRSFWLGVASGAVEPLAAVLTLAASSLIIPLLPYLLGFAAGAMFYVVVEELIPEMSLGVHSNKATIMFTFGFTLMMALDVALG